ncbi:hypothetical protein [Paractinoplanes lichenicola]|uniref:Uncharacterized protein n=1 Tax=Paractinoplanes lichenicola TaxID=2802976 RepID=A0ABS1VT84_9ACTN|nr:hypothetical protein [Actinoplanes lichenicola]MBL7257677.1 hypothetical protein [Actinoplanes lichenicola]
MADVRIDGADLIVELSGLDKLWALKSSLTIPLANVRGATLDPGITREFKGVKTAGTHVPGVITAGSFRVDGERVFWDVRNPMKAVVIELRDEHYTRLIVQVEDPHATIGLIEKSLLS